MLQNSWHDRYSCTHKKPNPIGLNFARMYLLFVSVVSIVLLQFTPNYSASFKIFLNFIWYPGLSIGLTASGFILGYDFYTDKHIFWKEWMKKQIPFYFSYYFYATLTIIIGVLTFLIIQNTHLNLSTYIAPKNDNNFLSQINYGWTDNISNWYGFLILYTLIPMQNFYILGTIFVVTLFFFLFFAPFIFNFLNKISFSSCTTLIVIFTLIACFLSTWSDVFVANPKFREDIPEYSYINLFTNWFLIFYLFLAGFYIRKYTKVIPWKIALIIFVIFSLICFSLETWLDFWYYNLSSINGLINGFNVFYIGANICSLPTLILSYLFLNIVSSYNSFKTKSNFLVKINHFNEINQKFISDQFMLVGLLTRLFIGILFFKITFNLDLSVNSNQNLLVGNSINKEWWGWLLIFVSLVVIFFVYLISNLKKEFIRKIFKHTWLSQYLI
ncbi:hypothetical protein [Mycoplasmoides alvi]|uniref:hypothetical protein n=1 Tax=Mycoplasmoides alvi TaxID=78580 RepID=UPI00051B6D68|nr:hypothetical protein [Mycoplasmoides alvi]